ncbi:ClpP/crotonase-like domain-containing protein [Terfezia claveryi]|nr:ClpP/crotonase-like domain-containing protein [Terfezia claveryi]
MPSKPSSPSSSYPRHLSTLPPTAATLLLSFPTPQTLLVTINRPEQMNCLNGKAHHEMERVWDWYDREGGLRCAVVTGARPKGNGRRAFCAGQDLKEWFTNQDSAEPHLKHPPGGFGGISRRTGKKPIIAAVDGLCMGGGFEMICNTDLTICTPSSIFSFPELSVGVIPIAGALPRLVYNVGLARASELVLTGRVLSAKDAYEWGIANKVTGEKEDVVEEAVKMAQKVCDMSPDGVIVARRGLRMALGGLGVEAATRKAAAVWEELERGVNIKEGLRAFMEKRKPRWVDSKL